VRDERAEKGFSYSGGSLRFDPGDLYESDPNPRAADYAEHDRLFRKMSQFNSTYSKMIEALTIAFGSRDESAARAAYVTSIDRMRTMPNIASAIYHAAGRAGVRAGVPFEYQEAVKDR
jgi:hypothetical protein